ncbi:uncharacterized protein BO95DRAFT_22005 [Aspergillus brunneoviolaceus CBS 621.78]|uniref:Uncharacterized protein n=1 Tax=Aspergillus brunneoviolaceus CBS 621.78 TaxID=1450534 RepID=A0ACD1FTC0_9EURO|nr:hypothetical protein BO95DRAFT_22005 [Aspergillus brunneoviolaceus CBS 621.78]RAH40219.1 hypothetical protein BO95DRAFT_22005 [Aspergillus brunneoviolaceus CBS 621.78]
MNWFRSHHFTMVFSLFRASPPLNFSIPRSIATSFLSAMLIEVIISPPPGTVPGNPSYHHLPPSEQPHLNRQHHQIRSRPPPRNHATVNVSPRPSQHVRSGAQP